MRPGAPWSVAAAAALLLVGVMLAGCSAPENPEGTIPEESTGGGPEAGDVPSEPVGGDEQYLAPDPTAPGNVAPVEEDAPSPS